MADLNTRVADIQHFDVTINIKNEDSSAAMLINHIKKSWDASKLKKKIYDSGITNRLLGFYLDYKDSGLLSTRHAELGRSDIVLFRIYGAKTELIIDRAQELINFRELSHHGVAPALYCTFNNGYCYKYIEGRVLTVEDMPVPEIYTIIAKNMARLHALKLSDNFLKNHKMESKLFDTLHRYINLVPKAFPDEVKQKRMEEAIASSDVLHGEVNQLSDAISKLKVQPNISFCHNDLLIANFVHDEYENEIYMIDHEYGCPNFSAHDIGNHFNEWAGNNSRPSRLVDLPHTCTNFIGVETVDYSLYPTKDVQLKWLEIYLKEYKQLKGKTGEVTSSELENLYGLVNKFALVSNLFWGVWGLIQAHYSEIDFDYLEYAITRFNEYFKNKEKFLALPEFEN